MTEAFLAIALVLSNALWALVMILQQRSHAEERNKVINSLIARKPEDLRDLTLADNVKIKSKEPPTTNPDYQAMEDLTDDEHFKAVTGEDEAGN